MLIRDLAYPTLLLLPLAAAAQALAAGVAPALIVGGASLLVGLILLLLQRTHPYEARWSARPKDYQVDTVHLIATGLVGDTWRALLIGGLTALSVWLGGSLDQGLWPRELAWPIQLILALLVGDLGAYFVHRACHQLPLLWRVHVMHHTSERLYVLSSARNHPLNVMLAFGSQVLPLALLGAGPELLTLVATFTSVNGLLQHANVDFRTGLLDRFLATATMHRWHHSPNMAESNSNFGSNLIVWDLLFGTRLKPAHREPREVGLPDLHVPTNVLAHLSVPFAIRRFEASSGAAPTEVGSPARNFVPRD